MLGRMSSLQILQHRTLSKGSSPELKGSIEQSQRLLPQRFITLIMYSGSTMESGVGKKYTIQGRFQSWHL